MNIAKFLLYTGIGTALWSSSLAVAGYLLGENYEAVERVLGPIGYVVLGVSVIAVIVTVLRRKKAGGGARGPA